MPCGKLLSGLIHTPQTLRAIDYNTWRTSTSCQATTRTSDDARSFPIEEFDSSGVIVFQNAIDTKSLDLLRDLASRNTFPQRFLCGQSSPIEFTDSNCLHNMRDVAFDHFVSQVHRVLAPVGLQLYGICEIVRINAHTRMEPLIGTSDVCIDELSHLSKSELERHLSARFNVSFYTGFHEWHVDGDISHPKHDLGLENNTDERGDIWIPIETILSERNETFSGIRVMPSSVFTQSGWDSITSLSEDEKHCAFDDNSFRVHANLGDIVYKRRGIYHRTDNIWHDREALVCDVRPTETVDVFSSISLLFAMITTISTIYCWRRHSS